MPNSRVYCISGRDTDIGKTIATGMIAKSFLNNGINTITQKIVQTGCIGISEDIVCHRQIMGVELYDVDKTGVTCPYVFSVPCSPHLAARLEQSTIDCKKISESTRQLLDTYEVVLLEGAGGLSVPLTRDLTFLDYLAEQRYPLILVTSSKLGSINHTLNGLELAQRRGIEIVGIIYNIHKDADPRIEDDSRNIFSLYLEKHGFKARVIDMHSIERYGEDFPAPDYYQLFFTK